MHNLVIGGGTCILAGVGQLRKQRQDGVLLCFVLTFFVSPSQQHQALANLVGHAHCSQDAYSGQGVTAFEGSRLAPWTAVCGNEASSSCMPSSYEANLQLCMLVTSGA